MTNNARIHDFWLFTKPHLPSVITLAALCTSFSSIYFALHDNVNFAILCVWTGGFLDALDGSMARYLDACSEFGAEIDSLADLVSFGVSPAIVVFMTRIKGSDFEAIGWFCMCVYVSCMAIRLARFNVTMVDTNLPKWSKNFFKGVPAPAGATLLMAPMYFKTAGLWWEDSDSGPSAVFYMFYSLFIASLLISSIRTLSSKAMKIPGRHRSQMPNWFVGIMGALICLCLWASWQFRLGQGPLDQTGWQLASIGTVFYALSWIPSHFIYLNLCKAENLKAA